MPFGVVDWLCPRMRLVVWNLDWQLPHGKGHIWEDVGHPIVTIGELAYLSESV